MQVKSPILVSPEQAEGMFRTAEPMQPEVVAGEVIRTQFATLEFRASTLGIEPVAVEGERNLKVTGNTVWNKCDVDAPDPCQVSACGLRNVCMSMAERRALNCAAANAELAASDTDQPGFVLTPTKPEVVFFAPDAYEPVTAQNEDGEQTVMYNKMKAGSTVVVSEHDIPEGGHIDMLINGADTNFGVALTEVRGVRYALAMMPQRLNLGDRDPKDHILSKGINALLDRLGIEGEERRQAIDDLKVDVAIGYSASLENFAHKVMVPTIELPEGWEGRNLATLTTEELKQLSPRTRDAIEIMKKNGLIDPETGEMTGEINTKMVMDHQYPGALEHGEVYPELEARMGIDAPYTDGGCPGDGQMCHVHYPKITRRTLVGELLSLGVRPENITYDASHAVDPASKDNRLASNRLMQNEANIKAADTLRSINGVRILFPPRS